MGITNLLNENCNYLIAVPVLTLKLDSYKSMIFHELEFLYAVFVLRRIIPKM
jgi:hypothetical protein